MVVGMTCTHGYADLLPFLRNMVTWPMTCIGAEVNAQVRLSSSPSSVDQVMVLHNQGSPYCGRTAWRVSRTQDELKSDQEITPVPLRY